jgi:hypothetical protein
VKWVYEVSLDHYLGEEDYSIMYSQFDTEKEAFKFAQTLFGSLLPTTTAEVRIKVNPQEG